MHKEHDKLSSHELELDKGALVVFHSDCRCQSEPRGIFTKKNSKPVAMDFYKSLQYIDNAIAESSGGMMEMKKVGEEEMKFLTLPMLKNPATY
jgi:hypothetical protein